MKVVGEWVSRPVPGRSIPRGARAPPQTRSSGSARLSASWTLISSARYAGAATSPPSASNCGIQKRFRFGSLPMITSRISGVSRMIAVT